jgi:hypothetical protein
MILTLNINQFNNDYIFISEPIKNNIIHQSLYYRILYSNNLFTLNGLYIILDIQYNSIEKYFNKYKCTFDINTYKHYIEQLKQIELDILCKNYNSSSNSSSNPKQFSLKIYEQLKNGIIKFFSEEYNKQQHNIILKISGIWETDTQCGLTYKFISV